MNQKDLVILDLDNTCICAIEMEKLKQQKYKYLSKLPNTFYDLEDIYRIYERPKLQEFLTQLFKKYHVAVWTAAGASYAKFVIDHFIQRNLPERPLLFFMWDAHCDYSESKNGQIKDISLIEDLLKTHVNEIILLDDNKDVLKQIQTMDSKDYDLCEKKAVGDSFFNNETMDQIQKKILSNKEKMVKHLLKKQKLLKISETLDEPPQFQQEFQEFQQESHSQFQEEFQQEFQQESHPQFQQEFQQQHSLTKAQIVEKLRQELMS